MKDKLQYFEHFCFDDGSMQLFIKLECADCRVGTSLLICTEDELDRIRNDRGRTDTSDPCSDGRDWGICEKHYFVSDTLNLTKPIMHGDLYFLMRSCQTSSNHVVQLSYEFMNGNDHLSCEHAASPLMYLCFTGLWLCTVLVWLFLIARNREQALLLHRMLAVVPLVQTLSMAVQSKYWENLNEEGEEREWMRVGWYLTSSLFKGLQFGALMILAKGWCIVRPDIPLTDRRTMILCVFWLIATTFTFQLLGGLFLFIWIVIYIVILRLLFSNIAYNHQMVLTQQSMHLAMNQIDSELRRLQVIAHMYKAFRVCMASYLIAQVMLYVVQTFLLSAQTQWLFTATSQTADWLLCLWVGFLFRSRSLPPLDPATLAQQGGAEELEQVRSEIVLVVNPSAATNKEELVSDGVAVGVRVRDRGADPDPSPIEAVVDVGEPHVRGMLGMPADVVEPEAGPATIDTVPVSSSDDNVDGVIVLDEEAGPDDGAGATGSDSIQETTLEPNGEWNVLAQGVALDEVVQPVVAERPEPPAPGAPPVEPDAPYGIHAYVWPTWRPRHPHNYLMPPAPPSTVPPPAHAGPPPVHGQ